MCSFRNTGIVSSNIQRFWQSPINTYNVYQVNVLLNHCRLGTCTSNRIPSEVSEYIFTANRTVDTPTTVKQRLSTNDCQQTTVNQRLSTNDRQPTTVNQRLSTNDCQPTTIDKRLSTNLKLFFTQYKHATIIAKWENHIFVVVS